MFVNAEIPKGLLRKNWRRYAISAAYCSQIETGQRMMSIETLVQVAEGLQTSADILIYGNTKDGRILHIVKMLESMPNDDLEFIENNILLVCNWLNQKSK